VASLLSAAQRAYVKELEMLKAELEQILSAVRPSRAHIVASAVAWVLTCMARAGADG
jgi:hypothetical protein